MKIFISWSGDLSRQVATVLKELIEVCIHDADSFVSSEDIQKGERWNEVLTQELEKSNFGIICLTKENVQAPWIHFEAGALSKQLKSRVSALAINTSIANIQGPLKSFQNTRFTKEDLFKLFISINNSMPSPENQEIIKKRFEALWTQFSQKVEKLISEADKASDEKSVPKLTLEMALEELRKI